MRCDVNRFASGLCVLAIVLMMDPSHVVDGKPTRTVCSIPIAPAPAMSLQSRYAVEEYYAPKFPLINWNYIYLDGPTQTPNSIVNAWLKNGTQCDVLMGPGMSSLAVAISPVVDRPWVCWSATSTALSDKSLYPLFSRVIPTDDVGATTLANAIARYGWTQVNVLTVDSAYGNSFTSGLSKAMQRLGGVVEASRSISTSPTNESVIGAFEQFAKSESRIVVLSMSLADVAFDVVARITQQKKLRDQYIFLFAEAFCSNPIPLYLSWDGAICATYTLNETLKQPFITGFNNRNLTSDQVRFAGNGWNTSEVNFYDDNIFASFAHDASLLVMTVLNQTLDQGNLSASDIVDRLRSAKVDGITGPVTMTAVGDRPSANAILYNVVNGSQRIIGSIVDMNMSDAGEAIAGGTGIFTMGQFYSPTTVPRGKRLLQLNDGSAAGATNFELLIAVVAAVGGFLVVMLVANKVKETYLFKRLVHSGFWIVVLQVLFLAGLVVLRVYTASMLFSKWQEVSSGAQSPASPVNSTSPAVLLNTTNAPVSSIATPFVSLFIVIVALSLAINAVEIVLLLSFFVANVRAKNDMTEEEIMVWDNRQDAADFFSAGLKDVPLALVNLLALAFLADGDNDVHFTVVMLLSLILACFYAGMKFRQIKVRVVKVLKRPPPPLRRFRSLRAVARFILMAIHFAGGKRFQLLNQYHPLHSGSNAADVAQYLGRMNDEQQLERIKYLKNVARSASALMKEHNITPDEFFGVVGLYLDGKYDPPRIDERLTETDPSDNPIGGGDQTERIMEFSFNPLKGNPLTVRPSHTSSLGKPADLEVLEVE